MKNKIKKIATISISIIFVIIMLFAIIQQANQRIEENLNKQKANQVQIEQVANIQEETTFETTSQEEANQLITEIQENNKKIVKIEVHKLNSQIKNTPIVITITYSN